MYHIHFINLKSYPHSYFARLFERVVSISKLINNDKKYSIYLHHRVYKNTFFVFVLLLVGSCVLLLKFYLGHVWINFIC